MVIDFNPNRLKRGFKVLLVAEGVCFLGAYYVFHRMNTDQDYRHMMHKKWPSVLELFYKSAEWGGIKDARENDYKTWGITNK
ncbi:protein CEBPZOS-like [Ptychodera flava]|uniref:protein CEBPZOS-like n=1 Tax=Ptychodera flava TaxID=63121 RepID=UPI00396A80AB